MTVYPMMSTMGVGRGIVFPNDSVWRLQPPAIKEMVELWTGNSGLSVPPPMMRTPYGMGADGSVWEYAPIQPGGIIQLFNGQYLPAVSSVSPNSGPAGTSVTITGSGFTGATSVKFGSTNATSFTVNSDTSITAVSPAIAPGTVALTVTTPNGTSIAGAPSQFTVVMTYTNWNPSDKSSNLSLTNGNLTAALSSSASAGVRAVIGRTSGKLYFEITITGTIATAGTGLSTISAPLTGNPNVYTQLVDGGVWRSGAYQGYSVSGGSSFVSGDILGIAVDLGALRVWFRRNNGVWNAGAGADPAANVGGLDISSIFSGVAAYPALVMAATGMNETANFGATAFSYTVPGGFTAGWGQ